MPAAVTGQDRMAESPLTRGALLAATGAKVGVNYLKHYARKAVRGEANAEELHRANATEVYATFSSLKGGPLKVAQMLSIDQNLLPPAYASLFAQAQYSAPPLSYPLVARTFRREFGRNPLELFDTFDPDAAHGASIGQVHLATKNGHRFAVKVQYPGVAESLRSDLALVKPLALQMMGLEERDVASFILEVETRLLEETDYLLELRRAQEIARACRHLSGLRFPRYYEELSSKKVLTMDWMEGRTLDKFADSEAPQDLRNRIGQILWDFYDFQMHQLRLFHADPHPGNFLVAEDTLTALDFGCTKQIDEDFYRANFRFLDPDLLHDDEALLAALEGLHVLQPEDGPEFRHAMLKVVRPSVELLARPFREDVFDFGDPTFMRSIYALGEQSRTDPTLRRARGARGSPHSIYVNRAYFGLYSLLSRLRSRVRTQTTRSPGWPTIEFIQEKVAEL
ncbi:MAG: AarF/UbiB family protein [Candidatus Methylacidiphilales bacterium]